MSEDQKAGTTLQDDGDDAAKAALAGTPDDAGRDAGAEDDEQKRTDWKALYLSSKDKIERANQLEREKAELEERLLAQDASPTRAQQPPDDAVREVQEEYFELVQRAQAGDVVARRMLREWEENAVRQRELADELYLARLRDSEGEAELRKFYKANKAHFNSIAAAHDALEGRKARQSRTELARKEKAADEVISRRDEGIVKTHTRDVSAGEVKSRKMTEAAIEAHIKELESAGKSDEVFAFTRKLRRGEIVVSG